MIKQNLQTLQSRIREYEKRYDRQPDSVSLLAVSKKQSIEKIQIALECGQLLFGESYVQEALPKIEFFKNQPIEWHFIGPLQSNKTKKIAAYFSWVHSIDSIKIAKRLSDQRPDHLAPLNICIEVNISNEHSKSGVATIEVAALAEYCLSLPKLKLRGLMSIPAAKTTLAEQRIEFHQLKSIFNDLCDKNFTLDTLSMGMSDDLEAAIAEGATVVRVGTAIFGERAK